MAGYPATISNFRLDAFEVTVGRFRAFVTASVGGWTATQGSGIHTYLNGGSGLVNIGASGYEQGWQTSWLTDDGGPATTAAAWTSNLTCDPTASTWTESAGANENLPINGVSWFEAYAFCIWDGGFLPSEAEYNYAFMGGTDENTYPWGTTVPGNNSALVIYSCNYGAGCTGTSGIAPVGTVPAGNGRWGQSDLAGNVDEWVLDSSGDTLPSGTCTDCTFLPAGLSLVNREDLGGDYNSNGAQVTASSRQRNAPNDRTRMIGFRCARAP